MRRSIGLAALFLIATIAAPPAHAQKKVEGFVAGQYSMAQGDFGRLVDDGWGVSGGVIYRPAPENHFAVRFGLGYSWFGAKSSTITIAQTVPGFERVDGGGGSIGTLTVEGLYEFGNPKVGGYIAVGIGGMRRYGQLTSTVVSGGYWCDPWTGICHPGASPGDTIVGNESLTKLEWTVAVGMTFGVGNGQLYLESQYHWMYGVDGTTEMWPIMMGYRF